MTRAPLKARLFPAKAVSANAFSTKALSGRPLSGRLLAGRLLAALLAAAAPAGFPAARAADFSAAPESGAPDVPPQGVPCSIGQPFWEPSHASAQELAERDGWPAVYYGHFSGGRPYRDASGQTLVDWRDEHMCFPSSRQCLDWVRSSHASFHEPEGYRGCLFLR